MSDVGCRMLRPLVAKNRVVPEVEKDAFEKRFQAKARPGKISTTGLCLR